MGQAAFKQNTSGPIRLEPGQRIVAAQADKPIRIGMPDGSVSERRVGDEVPEATSWPHGMAWVQQGRLKIVDAPELVEHDLSGEATVEYTHADGSVHRPPEKARGRKG